MSGMAGMDDPTEMADPYAAEPVELEATPPMADSLNEGRWEASRWQELSGLLTEDVD